MARESRPRTPAGGRDGQRGAKARRGVPGSVLFTLATGQFLMTLDSSVMNVSIAHRRRGRRHDGHRHPDRHHPLHAGHGDADDHRRQDRRDHRPQAGLRDRLRHLRRRLPDHGARAEPARCCIFGWSFLEGIGAALIMPAIVALVAGNFAGRGRARAYGLVAAAGAIAVAVGPLIGGLATTYFSWRWVFAGEVLIVLVILLLARRMARTRRPRARPHLDLVGAVLSAAGLGARRLRRPALRRVGLGRSPSRARPSWLGLSPTVWLILAGGVVLLALLPLGGPRLDRPGKEPLVDPALLRDPRSSPAGSSCSSSSTWCRPGSSSSSRCSSRWRSGCRAIDTGVRLLPLSVTLLLAAVGIPKLCPNGVAAPRVPARAARAVLAGIVVAARRRSTPAPAPRSSPCRCSSSASASARSPRSSAPSRCRRCPTSRAPRSAACRTPSPTSARRSARRWPARS